MKTEADTGALLQGTSQGTPGPLEAGKGMEGLFPRGSMACWHLDFRIPSLQYWERTNFCCFKLINLVCWLERKKLSLEGVWCKDEGWGSYSHFTTMKELTIIKLTRGWGKASQKVMLKSDQTVPEASSISGCLRSMSWWLPSIFQARSNWIFGEIKQKASEAIQKALEFNTPETTSEFTGSLSQFLYTDLGMQIHLY